MSFLRVRPLALVQLSRLSPRSTVAPSLVTSRRPLTTSLACRRSERESADPTAALADEIKEEAREVKSRGEKKLRQAKVAAEEASTDVKEGAQQVWNKAKKVARKVRQSVEETAAAMTEPVTERAKDKVETGSTPGSGVGPVFTPESAASSGSVGDPSSLRRSIVDGPQEMPQGVGRRARDDQGRPMETGKEGS